MSKAELETMWLFVNDTQPCDWYTTINEQIVAELKLTKTSAEELSRRLKDWQLKIPESVISCWSQELVSCDYFPLVVVDFEFLSMLDINIEKFGSSCLKKVTRLYSSNMPEFSRRLTVQHFVHEHVMPTERHKNFVVAESRIMTEPSNCNLDRVKD